MISLNYRDSRPIYEQIKDGLRKLIVTGALSADEKLPSVRALATQLSINPNTIQRAYNELESEGYIYSVLGRGSFVSAGIEASDRRRRQELLEKLKNIIDELRYLGVSRKELEELLDVEPPDENLKPDNRKPGTGEQNITKQDTAKQDTDKEVMADD